MFQLKALITGNDRLSPTLAGIRKNVASFRKQLNNTGLGRIGFKEALTGGVLAAPFILGAKKAIDFESAMADVRKVVTFDAPGQFEQMSNDVAQMSKRLPMAATDIARIYAAGGQAGFARDQLKAFAESAVKMGVAFDQTAEQSGEMMAKWRTSFTMTQDEVIDLADKINYLGNTGPANTRQISAIVTRIGPLGEMAGLASGSIAALGATMAGVGVEQDVAATGIKNFMLALTKGGAVTKAQSMAFKALRLDSKQVAKDMQKDAEGTVLKILGRIKDVDADARPALIMKLFGGESVTAIAPLLTKLDLLKSNLKKVGDASLYAGSMEDEYRKRAATTANALQLLRNSTDDVSRSIGDALLPDINAIVTRLRPLVDQVSMFIKDNPNLVRGIVAASAAFTAMSVGVWAVILGTKVLNPLLNNNPMIRIASLIALAVGLIVANWGTIVPFFKAIWEKIKGPALALWEWLKSAFSWSPIGPIMENWAPLTELFKAIWDVVVALAKPVFNFLKYMFGWTPIGMVIKYWEPLGEIFKAVWNVLLAISEPVFDFLKMMFDWSPLGMIIKHWEPITAFFKSLWDKVKPILEPMMKWLGIDDGGQGLIKTATNRANAFAEEQRIRNAGVGGGTGAFLQADLAQDIAARSRGDVNRLLRRPGEVTPGSLVQQTMANNRTDLQGSMVFRFENAPSNLRVESTQTNQPGLDVTSKVGYRGLSQRG
ncbi:MULTISPECIES: phage tail tape measure protein [unclassified Pseudomonas]|uniref:phage tail tape measure protein n=1 Tax=unclassified Pseudomonas TaxID=196821 RepID=UPI00128BBB3F|nr:MULTISPECIES: phage tail tape measure protein [unclassified Pseudomonas]MPQ67811.1 phage tail tape measure protein [Pseudomonas sp. MWU12-2323]